MSYLDQVNDKRLQQSGSQQMNAMLEMMAANTSKKPSVILTDSTDLGEHISELGDKIIEVMEAVRADKSTASQLDKITELIDGFKDLQRQVQQAAQQNTNQIIDEITALKKLITNQKPVVVPAPVVNFKNNESMFQPLIDRIDGLLGSKQEFDMTKYRAQDMDESGSLQYIGFSDTSGTWYIMENNMDDNTMRYVFGDSDYGAAWDERMSLDYKPLSEAVNALRS